MAEGVEMPLRGQSLTNATQDGSAHSNSDSDSEVTSASEGCAKDVLAGAQDAAASVVFWYLFLFAPYPLEVTVTDAMFYSILGTIALGMLVWRIYRARTAIADHDYAEIPYTCGFAAANDKELFIVATLHISPRAPRDVHAVIGSTHPDVAMIELDEERLDRMRDEEAGEEHPQEPQKEDLQPIKVFQGPGHQPFTVYAQRALWNAEREGDSIVGDMAFDEDNPYAVGAMDSSVFEGKFALVRRGSPNGEFAPFALKAHKAARSGAAAVLVISSDEKLPVTRIGGGSVIGDLRVAFSTCSCGFPPIPVMLLVRKDGEKLLELCHSQQPQIVAARAELDVLGDSYPRRTLRKRLCQACALMCTGIGILYGIIHCFNVEVGAEFLAAEQAASSRGIPCVCIDVDLNQFWSRLGSAVLPTPCNIGKSFLSWLAFPRVFFRVLFPARGSVDVIGSMFLHAASFSLRTWIAFILAGFCASFVTNKLLYGVGYGTEKAAEEAGVVKEEDAEDVQTYIMLAIEMYLLPRIYEAVAASRDEAMYCSIVAKSRELMARRMVVVVGAAHSNGILQRIRARGL
jgi:hypothetical protein